MEREKRKEGWKIINIWGLIWGLVNGQNNHKITAKLDLDLAWSSSINLKDVGIRSKSQVQANHHWVRDSRGVKPPTCWMSTIAKPREATQSHAKSLQTDKNHGLEKAIEPLPRTIWHVYGQLASEPMISSMVWPDKSWHSCMLAIKVATLLLSSSNLSEEYPRFLLLDI